jgi:signal peptidase I
LASFLVKLALIVFVVRSFIFSPFSIPSESMMPRLLIGDYLFITKWNYGYSRHSLPWSVPLIPGRIFPGTPARGDVVVFKAPGHNGEDWIKRVIGLPGDSIQMVNGQLDPQRQGDPQAAHRRVLELPITPNRQPVRECNTQFQAIDAKGNPVCKHAAVPRDAAGRQGLQCARPGHLTPQDNTVVFTVPAGHVFLMGDNRDNSTDSRFAQPPVEQGISYVPMENIEGKAVLSFWSTDGSANWFLPWTWFTAARWSRIGEGF